MTTAATEVLSMARIESEVLIAWLADAVEAEAYVTDADERLWVADLVGELLSRYPSAKAPYARRLARTGLRLMPLDAAELILDCMA